MAKNGLAYPIETQPLDTRTDEERAIDLDSRRLDGYGLYHSRTRTHTSEKTGQDGDFPTELDRYVSQLPENDRVIYRRALFGGNREYSAIRLPDGSTTSFPTKGCVAEARAALFGDVVLWARVAYIPQTFNNILTKRVTDDPDYAATIDKRRACMAKQGYQFASPEDAAKQVGEK